MAKIIIDSMAGSQREGLEVRYFITDSANTRVFNAGTFNVSVSHPDETKQIFGILESVVRDILKDNGYVDKPDIAIVTNMPSNNDNKFEIRS